MSRGATRAVIAVSAGLVLGAAAPAIATTNPTVSIDRVQQSHGALTVSVSLHGVDASALRTATVTADLAGAAAPVTVTSSDAPTDSAASPSAREALLLLDTSGSMAGARINSARAAADAFLDTAPADVSVGVASVADHATLLVGPTRDRSVTRRALARLSAAGDTHLYDGVKTALSALGTSGQRLLVVLSDGADTGSHETLPALLAQVRSSGVTVDAIGLQTSAAQHAVLARLSASGDGRVMTASAGASLATAFRSTAQDLVSRLTLTIHPAAALAGRAVPLRIQVAVGEAHLEDTTTVLLSSIAVGATGGTPVQTHAPARSRGLWGTARGLELGLLAIFLALGLLALTLFGGRSQSHRLHALMEQHVGRTSPTVTEAAAENGSFLGGTGLMRSALALTQRLVQKEGREERLALLLDRAGLRIRPNEWLVVRGISALLGLVLFAVMAHSVVAGLLLGTPLGLFAPQAWLNRKAKRRRNAFVDRLPDSLQLVAGSLSAGYSLLQALDGLVQEGEEPVSGEVARALASARLGVPIEDALDQVAQRLDSPDFSWTAMAIRIQREVGGNLGEVLLTVGETLRERAALRRQVRALSAEGRLSGYILVAIPLLLGLYEVAFRRDYARVLWTTPVGIAALVATAVLMVIGSFWMRAVVNVEV